MTNFNYKLYVKKHLSKKISDTFMVFSKCLRDETSPQVPNKVRGKNVNEV